MTLSSSLKHSLGVLALIVAGVALWRTESRASSTPARAPAPRPTFVAARPVPPTAPAPQLAANVVPPAPLAVQHAASQPLQLRRLVLARGVQNHEPVEPGRDFALSPGDSVYAFAEFVNSGSPTEVRVRFERQGHEQRPVGDVALSIPSEARYRTWSFTRMLREPGLWTAIVTLADGRVLARESFRVSAAPVALEASH